MKINVCDDNFIILIPALAGTKSVPNENRKLIHSTLKSIPSDYRRKIWVSTNDASIKDICKKEIISCQNHKTPSASYASSLKQIVHEFIHEQRITKTIIILSLLYPNRTWNDVARSYNFFKSHKATSLLCRKEIIQHPYLMMKEINSIYGEQLIKHNLYRKQDYPKVFEISHYISIIEPWKFRELGSDLFNEKTIFWPISSEIKDNTEVPIDNPVEVPIANPVEVKNKDGELNNARIINAKTKTEKSKLISINDFAKYIKGKRVCLVANSSDLLKEDLGEYIDNHDFVIRFNSFKIDEKHTGKKINMHACIYLEHQNCDIPVDFRFVISVNKKRWEDRVQDIMKLNNCDIINCNWPLSLKRNKTFEGSVPSTGINVLLYLLLCKSYKEINLVGFNCYENGLDSIYRLDGTRSHISTIHNYNIEQDWLNKNTKSLKKYVRSL